MLKTFTTLLIDQTITSMLSPYSVIVFNIFLQKNSRFAGSVLLMNAIEASFKNPLWPVLENFLKKHSSMQFSERQNLVIVFIINSSKFESVYCLTQTLLQAFLTSH